MNTGSKSKPSDPEGPRLPDGIHFLAKTTADGQPGISVRDHSLNVGCVAEALIGLLPAPVRALVPPGAATLAALHDVGKICPGFQAKSDAWIRRFCLSEFARDSNYEAASAMVCGSRPEADRPVI